LIDDERPEKADAAVVLGGDEFGQRTVKAAQLQRAGYVPYVLVSGPPALLGYESEEMIEYAKRQGFPEAIFRPLHHQSDSTRSESDVLAKYLREHGVRTVLLVTSNYHTKRAAKLMRAANPGVRVIPIAAPDPFTAQTWWKTRYGLKMFLYEWLKTIATDLGV
jgi:uncharacterized SAM-binding protein YcdF (DUF218 family)